MKTLFFWVCLTIANLTAVSKPANQPMNQIIGTWKFSSQSKINDFQKVFTNQPEYQTEFFTFNPNHTFIHEFADENGIAIKSMKGKWKLMGDKISIIYNDIDYIVYSEYFYIGKDLVLGKNFNHIVFTRENVDFLDVAVN